MFQTNQPTQAESHFDYAEYRAKETEGLFKQHATLTSGVILPLAQAVATGFILGLAAGVVTWSAGWGNPWRVFLVVSVIVISLAWLGRLAGWLGFFSTLETILKADLNGDGQIGEPVYLEPETVRVEVKSEDGRKLEFADIPTSKEKLSDLARGILAGQPFSENAWSGAGALFSRDEFRRVRSAFMDRGFLRWKDSRYPQQGTELSPAGKAVLRQFASFSAADSPTLTARKS